MKKLSSILLAILLLMVKFSYADPKVNKICFTSTTNLTKNGDYYQEKHNLTLQGVSLLNYNITESYTFEPDTLSLDNSDPTTPCFSIKADRKASTGPREWVQDKMGVRWNESNMVTGEPGDSTPNELNFAMLVNVTFILDGNNYFTCNNLFLGQGNIGLGLNNWWIFSNNNQQNYTISCILNNDSKQLYYIDMRQSEITDSKLNLGFAKALEAQ